MYGRTNGQTTTMPKTPYSVAVARQKWTKVLSIEVLSLT